MDGIFCETTRSIKVTVMPRYLPEQSYPADNGYVWSYHVTLVNYGTEMVKLLHRYWKIIDADGRMQEVRGAGVVGKQPLLAPGEVFEYSSGTSLYTPSGIMVGYYEMIDVLTNEMFTIAIPAFSLDSPHQYIQLH